MAPGDSRILKGPVGLIVIITVAWPRRKPESGSGIIVHTNCGDWVESCTAVTESFDGTFEIVHWIDESRMLISATRVAEAIG